MSRESNLAIAGGTPAMTEPLSVGQFYWPEWERYEAAVRDIFARRHYASQRNPGPLVAEFERRLEQFLGVKHAVLVPNATIGLMMSIKALELHGDVLVPSWSKIGTVEALARTDCRPVFCDIDPETQQMSLDSIRSLLETKPVDGILGVHLWGNAAQVKAIDRLAEEFDVPLLYDAAHAFGCQIGGRSVASFGQAVVFSFHETEVLSTGDGGCITTDDDALALKLRIMRNDTAAEPGIFVLTSNGRVSEIQAAVGLMMLEDFEKNRANNQTQFRLYQELLQSIAGIFVLKHSQVSKTNFQFLTATIDKAEFGLTRDQLLEVLKAENVFAGRFLDMPCHVFDLFSDINIDENQLLNTQEAALNTFQLPIGARVSAADIKTICKIIFQAHINSTAIGSELPVPVGA